MTRNKEARKIVSFDWAIKTILRDKANADVLEGLLSALFRRDVQVVELLVVHPVNSASVFGNSIP